LLIQNQGKKMILKPDTKINDMLNSYDFLLDFLVTLSPKFKLLKNPIARNTVGKVATLSQISSIGGIPVKELIEKIAAEIKKQTGKSVEVQDGGVAVNEPIVEPVAKHEMLKAIIRHLHDGGDVNEAKPQFAELVKDVDASEIAAMEQRLIAEGMPQEEVKRLCDVHVQVFKESIEVKDVPQVEEGHPIHTFMVENRALEKLLDRISDVVKSIGNPPSHETYKRYDLNLTKLLESLGKVNLHYLRKENQLFPILEKHEITGPSQVMWSLDDDIRAMIKNCVALHKEHDLPKLLTVISEVSQALHDMIYKEERILFPMAVETLSSQEWESVKKGEAEIGFAWIFPTDIQQAGEVSEPVVGNENTFPLSTGNLNLEQIDLMLTHLPVDISFVDESDEVRYYSASKDRIFPRSPGVIGRKVQNCHPPKSMPVVQEILDDFRSGKKDDAEFWITIQEKFIHIRYFAMRSANGDYRGCLEVTQDVTGIRNLEGEKRLLGHL
jgi:uncharacterized protein